MKRTAAQFLAAFGTLSLVVGCAFALVGRRPDAMVLLALATPCGIGAMILTDE